jgi:ABC-type transport system involved in multi-copper enzyme maturation permease subunit
MFFSLLRKEIAQQVISAKFAVMTLLVIVLATLSVVVMVRDYQLRVGNYEILAPTDQDTVAIKRPAPMSMLVKGLDERMGRSIVVESMGLLEVGTSQSDANRLFALFREIDMQFVAQVIMSLAAVIFSFDMISREKRRGTLKLMLTNGVSRAKVLLAKLCGALVVVAIPALAALLFGLIYMQFTVPQAFTADFYLRVLVFAGLILLYVTAFISIGLFISSLTHRPAVSLVLAMLVWALLVFVVPNAAYLAGRNIAGGETLEQQEVKVRHIWTSAIFRANNDPGPRPPFAERAKEMAGELANEYRHYINLAEGRIGWVRSLNYFSPAGPFSFAVWAAAGTGPDDALEFQRDVLRYQSTAIEDAVKLLTIARGQDIGEPDFKPRKFAEQGRTLPEAVMDEILPGAGALLLMSLVFFALSFLVFIRYDVR